MGENSSADASLLSRKDIQAIAVRYSKTRDETLAALLYRHAQPFIYQRAWYYNDQLREGNHRYDDLISAGDEGFVYALRDFTPKFKNFKAYSHSRIKNNMIDYIRNQSFLPRTAYAALKAFDAFTLDYVEKHAVFPNRAVYEAYWKTAGLSSRELLEDLLSGTLRTFTFISVDNVLYDEDGMPFLLGNAIHDPTADNPFECVCGHDLSVLLRKDILQLPRREQRIFEMYLYERRALEDIGKTVGLTESRIFQIIHAGFHHPQQFCGVKETLGYVNGVSSNRKRRFIRHQNL